MVEMIARMMKMDVEKDSEEFLVVFNELLKSFYQISDEELENLINENPEKDQLLFEENLRNSQLQLFLKAANAYFNSGDWGKVKICLKIIDRIQSQPTKLFEFSPNESLRMEDEIVSLKNKLNI